MTQDNKKLRYEKPSMMVIKIDSHQCLLQASLPIGDPDDLIPFQW